MSAPDMLRRVLDRILSSLSRASPSGCVLLKRESAEEEFRSLLFLCQINALKILRSNVKPNRSSMPTLVLIANSVEM